MGDTEGIVPVVSEHPPPDASHAMDEVLSKAMAWVEGSLGIFLPEVDRWTPDLVRRQLGYLLDLAITCRFLCRGRTPVQRAAERILDAAAEVFHRESFHDGLLRMAAKFPYYLWLLAIFWENDRLPDPRTRRAAQALIAAGYGDLADPARSAHKRMELSYILDLGGFDGPLPPLHELRRRDPVEAPIDPVRVTEAEAYAVTHVIFYLTDFAARPLSHPTPGSDAAVDLLLEGSIRARHWDLVSELLVCRRALGRPEGDLDRLGRSCLLRAQSPDGAMPGPGFDLRERDALPPRTKEAYTFLRCYHTTLATVMCAGAESRGRSA